MPIHGKFIVNSEHLAPLMMFGVGAFMAFSGNGPYRNRGGCTAIPNNGPIPAGKYWIVDRPRGGLRSRTQAWLSDAFNSVRGTPSYRDEWFALYRDDGLVDDHTWVDLVKRGNFRLHPTGGQGRSLGCITLASYVDYQSIRRALLSTTTTRAGNSGIKAYGWIEVTAYGNACP